MNPAEFSNHMKSCCTKFHGSAGQYFTKKLAALLQDDSDATIQTLREAYVANCHILTPEEASPEQARAINRFAAVQLAGSLAAEFGILPFTDEEIADAVKTVVDLSIKHAAGIPDVERALVRLQDFLIRNHAGCPSIKDSNISSPKCFRDSSKGIFIFTDEQLKAACGYDDLQSLAKELKSRSLLFINENGRFKSKHKLSGCSTFVRLYSIKAAIIETELNVSDRDSSASNDTDDDI